ncbi:MAG: hypothetical protein H7829_19160 [Magnetococcus sp. THC-1_WYH]
MDILLQFKTAEGLPTARKRQDSGNKKRNPGKQPGAAGHGRKVELPLAGSDEIHRASRCAGCSAELGEDSPFTARLTGTVGNRASACQACLRGMLNVPAVTQRGPCLDVVNRNRDGAWRLPWS